MKHFLFGILLTFLFIFKVSASSCDGIPLAACRQLNLHEGYLSMPLDWLDRSDSRQINIRYRIIGYDRTDKPYLFFIGGGPGVASIENYYYPPHFTDPKGLLEHYRVVIFDQRGTGSSTPLNQTSSDLTAEMIARYFSARQIVRDLGYLIRQFGVKDREFDILGHSAGGIIAAQYLAHKEVGPRPRGVVFAHMDPVSSPNEVYAARFANQIKLNEQVLSPNMKRQVIKIRRRLAKINSSGEVLPLELVNALVDEIDNPESLTRTLSELASARISDEDFLARLKGLRFVEFGTNKVLGALSAVYQEGRSDLELALLNNHLAQQEKEWMLLDRRTIKALNTSNFGKQKMGAEFELSMRLAGRKYSDEMIYGAELGALSDDVAVVSLLGTKDTYVDYLLGMRSFDRYFRSPRHMREVILNGTHYEAFKPEMAQLIVDRIAELSSPNRVAQNCDAWIFPTSERMAKTNNQN